MRAFGLTRQSERRVDSFAGVRARPHEGTDIVLASRQLAWATIVDPVKSGRNHSFARTTIPPGETDSARDEALNRSQSQAIAPRVAGESRF